MNEDQLLALMKRFRVAYGRADRDALLAVTSADFEWHQHYAEGKDQQPSGRILSGVDALLEEIRWRGDHWSEVRYEGLVERAAADLLVQTFTISGSCDGEVRPPPPTRWCKRTIVFRGSTRQRAIRNQQNPRQAILSSTDRTHKHCPT